MQQSTVRRVLGPSEEKKETLQKYKHNMESVGFMS
jgi:hypothetical protein